MTYPIPASNEQAQAEKILVVDDEHSLLLELRALLQMTGYQVVTAVDGQGALDQTAQMRPDLILLDVKMPPPDGWEVLRILRHERNNWTPVILLTSAGAAAERAASLYEGADDYLNKPFDRVELLARIKAVLRRARRGGMPLSSYCRLAAQELELNRQSRQVCLGGKTLALSPRSFSLLEYLMLHPQETISRERLLEQVWGWAQALDLETRVVDNMVARLRKELSEDARQPRFLQTVTNQGYCFIAGVEGRS